jgi:hypothetical protein
MRLSSALITFSMLWVPAFAFGEFVDCNGVVTNKPCSAGQKILEEKPHVPQSNEQKAKQMKELWITELDLERLRAGREHGVRIDISFVKDQCRTASLEKCDQLIREKRKELREGIVAQNSSTKKQPPPKRDTETNVTQINNVLNVEDSYISGRRIVVHDRKPTPEGYIPGDPKEPWEFPDRLRTPPR